jgi:hypothetical protein
MGNKKMVEKSSNVLIIFKESLLLLLNEPELFIPKIIIAILYGVAIYFQTQLFLEVLEITRSPSYFIYIERIGEILFFLFFLLIYNVCIYVLDIFVNSLYPTLINQVNSKTKISIFEAIKNSKKYFSTMFFSSTIPLIFLSIIIFPLSLLVSLNQGLWMIIDFFIFFVIGYLFIMLFYFLYPVVILGKKNTLFSIKETINLSIQHKKQVFFLSIVPFFVTIIKTISAFLAQDSTFFMLFVFLVLLTGIVYTYHMVMNPYLYLKIK